MTPTKPDAESTTERATAPATELRYASTVMLFRDSQAGPEVLLLERSGKSQSFGGAFVFPGGKVDLHDAHRDFESLYAGHSDIEASRLLNVPEYGLAYWMAAIRECFEEVGILLAYNQHGDLVSFKDPAVRARFSEYRDQLNRSEITLLDICREEKLKLATERMHYYSHWVTPTPLPVRFDTRFFACRTPDHQESIIDNHEAVSQVWVNPAEALRRQREEGFAIFFPTIKNLIGIAQHTSTEALLDDVAQYRDIPRILPLRVEQEDKVKVLIPGDEGYHYHETAKTHY
ncbi:MAG: hypothetical protein V7721_02920 [Porticoccaceae bacterium]